MNESIGISSTEYNSWRAMKGRCNYKKNREYSYYGARGIKVCTEWSNSAQAFFDDMGRKPDTSYSLDRVDVNGDYCKANCRWATREEQQRNKRNSINLSQNDVKNIRSVARKSANGKGCGYSRSDIAEMFGVSLSTTVRILSGAHYLCKT